MRKIRLIKSILIDIFKKIDKMIMYDLLNIIDYVKFNVRYNNK